MIATASSTTTLSTWTIAIGSSTSSPGDRKSTRLNSSHLVISYAVFCLKKKTNVHKNELHARCARNPPVRDAPRCCRFEIHTNDSPCLHHTPHLVIVRVGLYCIIAHATC